MQNITSNESLTKALVAVKRGEKLAVRLTKKHAKDNGISWAHFENSVRILKLKMTVGGNGHTVMKP